MRKSDSVTVICYGIKKIYRSREEAIRFYLAGMRACEGSERDRYTEIYLQLLDGCKVCTDEP